MNSTDDIQSWNELTTIQNLLTGNITIDSESEDIKINYYSLFSFTLCVLKCVLSFLVVVGNGLTLTIIIRHVKKTPSHVSVGFLECADLLFGLTPWFFLAMYLNTEILHNTMFCTFSAWIERFAIGLDGFAIVAIACERYIVITNWQIHRKFLNVRRWV